MRSFDRRRWGTVERTDEGLRITLRYSVSSDAGVVLVATAAAIGGALSTPSIGALGIAVALAAVALVGWTVVRARRVAVVTFHRELRVDAPWSEPFEPVDASALDRITVQDEPGLGHRVVAIRRDRSGQAVPVVPYHRRRSAVVDVARLLADRLAYLQTAPAPRARDVASASAPPPASLAILPAAPPTPQPAAPLAGGLARLGPALRAMIDRGLAVEVSWHASSEWMDHALYRSNERGRYVRSVSSSPSDGSGVGGGPVARSFVDAPEVEREMERSDAIVVVLDRDRAFVTTCSRCRPLADALGARPDRVYADDGVYLTRSAWSALVRAWGGDADSARLSCPECGRHAEREPLWRWERTVFVAGRDDSRE